METITVIGAGLVGSVLSMFLAKAGHRVDVYERNPDIRGANRTPGRSINLTLCDRGFNALDALGAGDIVRGISVPVYGRLIHGVKADLSFQPYGNNNEAIYSISRSDLNEALLNFAEENFDIKFHFNEKCIGVDLETATVEMKNSVSGTVTKRRADRLFGCDGAHSAVRMRLQKLNLFNFSQQYWDQGYKELHVPPGAGGCWASKHNALHIWPRGHYMLIAFPNTDGSFTCSLHIPYEGKISFQSIKTGADLSALFEESFPDVIRLMPNLAEDFFRTPPHSMITIKCSPWSFKGKVALTGDAAHAIYPSYGQGANTGFEDCLILYECMQRHGRDWESLLREYESMRKPNTDAIADLCVEHFIELRDLVGDQRFQLRKEIERKINRLYPEKYKDLYSMITFTCRPHAEAWRIDRRQRAIVDEIMRVEGIEHKLDSTEVESLIGKLLSTTINHCQ
jgi:kynurenine 3-monooxygenase